MSSDSLLDRGEPRCQQVTTVRVGSWVQGMEVGQFLGFLPGTGVNSGLDLGFYCTEDNYNRSILQKRRV